MSITLDRDALMRAERISAKDHTLETFEEAQRFAFAGKARVRMVSVATGKSVNMRIIFRDKPYASQAWRYRTRPFPAYFAVESDGLFVGFLRLRNGTTKALDTASAPVPFGRGIWSFDTRSSKADPDVTKAIDWLLSGLLSYWHDQVIPDGLELWRGHRCGQCDRVLKDPVSVETGFGPVCTAHRGGDRATIVTKGEVLDKASEAAEIDWRPTETLPEDFYAI